jgi:hypothetical protein
MNSSNSYLGRKRASAERYDDRQSYNSKRDIEAGHNNDYRNKRDRDYNNSDRYGKRKQSYSPEDHRNDRRCESHSYTRRHNDDYYERPRYQKCTRGSISDLDSNTSSIESDRNSDKKHLKKKYNFLICLPKNFFRFIEQGYDPLLREVFI